MADPKPRPLTRHQVVENEAFLAALARTGNAHEAARSLGVHRGTYAKRRARHPLFAAAWDAALAEAQARLGGRTAGQGRGGTRLVRGASGRVQLRRLKPRPLGRAAEQAFLAALSATANIRLSAAAAGFSHSAFYLRRRDDPGFAREWRLALETGYRRLEEALLESYLPEAHEHDAWRHNEPPPIPPMSAAQALHMLTLHRKTVEGLANPLPKRRGESWAEWSLRAALMGEQRLERRREEFRVAEAARRGAAGPAPGEAPPVLPALDQVTGWSKARGERRATGGPSFSRWREDEG